jgi:hypothetical protein
MHLLPTQQDTAAPLLNVPRLLPPQHNVSLVATILVHLVVAQLYPAVLAASALALVQAAERLFLVLSISAFMAVSMASLAFGSLIS